MSTNFCVWPEGLILLAHCLLFFPLSLNLPRGMKHVFAYRKHLSKDKQCLKKTQCRWRWQQSSLLFPLHLLLFLIWPSNTRSEIVSSSVIFFFFSLIFRKLFVGKHMLLISNQVEREEDEHIHYGNFKAFSNYILNTSRVLASFEVQDFFDCAFKCIAKTTCFSFNIAILPSANLYSYACHLLASDKYNDSSQFLQSQEFHHFAVVVSFNWPILNF